MFHPCEQNIRIRYARLGGHWPVTRVQGPAEPTVIVAHKGGVFGVSGSRVNSVIATVGIRAAANQQVGILGVHGLRDAMANTNKIAVSRVCLACLISVYGWRPTLVWLTARPNGGSALAAYRTAL